MTINVTYSPATLADLLATLDALEARGINAVPVIAPPVAPRAGSKGWGPNVRTYCTERKEKRFCQTQAERSLGLDNEEIAAQRMAIDGWQSSPMAQAADDSEPLDVGSDIPHDGSPLF